MTATIRRRDSENGYHERRELFIEGRLGLLNLTASKHWANTHWLFDKPQYEVLLHLNVLNRLELHIVLP